MVYKIQKILVLLCLLAIACTTNPFFKDKITVADKQTIVAALTDLVDAADVRVVQRRRRLDFVCETPVGARIHRKIRR